MLTYNIPGMGQIEIENIVFDYNGTIAKYGKLLDGIGENFKKLSESLRIHVVTADTHGSVKKELGNQDITLKIIPPGDQDTAKLSYIKELGSKRTISVGNGENDKMMLKEAEIGFAVLGDEGLSTGALLNSDIVIKNIFDIFDILLKKDLITATLRF